MPFSGTVAVRAMKASDYQAVIYPGTAAGIQAAISYAGENGEVRLGPGTVAFGTSTLTVSNNGLKLIGAGQRATLFTYSGSGDFLTLGINDGNHAGVANAYNNTASQVLIQDIGLQGPGIGTTARAIVDWENGSQVLSRVYVATFGTGFYGIGSDVNTFKDCLFNQCGTGAFLASRCDQNSFYDCYWSLCTIGVDVEYAWGSRFIGCQFVFSTTCDLLYDAPASGTDGGDIRADAASTIVGCWFESASGAQLPRHIWIGRGGTSGRRVNGVTIYGGYVLASNTLNFVDVEATSSIHLRDVFQGGTVAGSFVNVVAVGGLTQEVSIHGCSRSGGALITGGTAIDTFSGDVTMSGGTFRLSGTNATLALASTGTEIDFPFAGSNIINATGAGSNLQLKADGATRAKVSAQGLDVFTRFIFNDDVGVQFKIAKATVGAGAPGAGFAGFRFEAGTNPGTAKLVAYAGTSTTGTTVIDNIGGGF